jgi:hypothetical protein
MLTPLIMSPWHATRILLEAQRRMAFSVLRLVFGSDTRNPRPSDRRATGKAEASVTTSPPKIVAAHRATRVDKKRARPKSKPSKRMGKAKVGRR